MIVLLVSHSPPFEVLVLALNFIETSVDSVEFFDRLGNESVCLVNGLLIAHERLL